MKLLLIAISLLIFATAAKSEPTYSILISDSSEAPITMIKSAASDSKLIDWGKQPNVLDKNVSIGNGFVGFLYLKDDGGCIRNVIVVQASISMLHEFYNVDVCKDKKDPIVIR